MDNVNFYFRQIVGEADLDLAFDHVEFALQDIITDANQVGIISGGDLVEHAPPNLTVEVDTPLIAHDQFGNRIYAASIDPVDISVDSNLVSTDVSGPGREKWVSVFITYDLVLSDERIDGNSNIVYWLETASYAIVVVQGAEDNVGLAVPTGLLPDALLLGDVLRYDGQIDVQTADIDLSRQQVAFPISSANYDVLAGTSKEAISAVLDIISEHVDASAVGAHLAQNIEFDPTGTGFEPGDTNVGLALSHAASLVAPYPGNLFYSPDRHLTHGVNGDWRDSSYVQRFSIADAGLVPGGGGNVDIKIGGVAVDDGENGFIEFEDSAVYNVEVSAGSVTNLPNANALWTYRSFKWVGMVRNAAGILTILANPAVNANAGGVNLTMSLFASATNILYVRITGAVALAGVTLRSSAHVTVQRTLYP